jgi:tRNA-dihydrouridine synthase B
LANGNVSSAATAMRVLAHTQAAGVMIGRAAIRNPWIFRQVRQFLAGQVAESVTLGQVRDYIDRLHQMQLGKSVPESSRVSHLKMYLNYIGQSVDAEGIFLRDMRRAKTEAELFSICDRELLGEAADGGTRLFATEPYIGLFARPQCEA